MSARQGGRAMYSESRSARVKFPHRWIMPLEKTTEGARCFWRSLLGVAGIDVFLLGFDNGTRAAFAARDMVDATAGTGDFGTNPPGIGTIPVAGLRYKTR